MTRKQRFVGVWTGVVLIAWFTLSIVGGQDCSDDQILCFDSGDVLLILAPVALTVWAIGLIVLAMVERRSPLRLWWLGASGLLVCIGSLGPWENVLSLSTSGLEVDGWRTLLAGLAALGLLAIHVRSDPRPRPAGPLVLIFVCAVIAAATGVNYWSEVERAAGGSYPDGTSSDVSVGWGLVLVTLAGSSLVVSTIVAFLRRAQEHVPTSPRQRASES